MNKKPEKKKKPVKKPKIVSEGNEIKRIKVKVIGIGNGAGSIVADIAQDLKKVNFLAANTDRLALSKLKRRVKIFQFGQEVTAGFGTGMKAELGQLAAEKDAEKIEKSLKGCDLCVLVACLGGGTGSGAAPVFAKISKKLGNLTYAIFTLPFDFEGEKKLKIAREALKKTRPFVNAVTIVPNERIFKIVDKKLPLKEALSSINRALAFNLSGLIETIYNAGIINIDFADLRSILKGWGSLSYLSRAEAKGEDRAKKVLERVLTNPLYPYNVAKAKRVLFDITGPANLSISEVAEISQGIFNAVSKRAKVIFGVSRGKDKDKIGISLLAMGCEMGNLFPGVVPQKKKKEKVAREQEEEVKQKPKLISQKPKKEANTRKKINRKKKLKKKTNRKTKVANKKNNKKKKKEIIRPPVEKKKIEVVKPTAKEKVRKNGLQVQKEIEELEKEIRKKEEIWEIPAFLRRKEG